MVSSGGDANSTAEKLGIPVEFIEEAVGYTTQEVLPDNLLTVNTFIDLLTQWRVGPSGATGLVYESMKTVFWARGIKAEDREDVFEGIQIMERSALREMRRE